MAKKIKFKESIGIDIGTHSIKVVHLKRQSHGYKLLGCLSRPTVPVGVEYDPNDLRPERNIATLSNMFKELRINPKKVKHLVTSIGGDQTSIKQIKTIFLPDDELESALVFEAKKHMAISGGSMELDYQVLGVEEKTNNMNILLTVASKNVVEEHTKLLHEAGLSSGIVDVESLAVANARVFSAMEADGVYVMLNIGAHKTNMVVHGANAKFFARDITFGGYNITQDIMKKEDVEFDKAEEIKLDKGLNSGKKEEGLSLMSLDISDKSTEELLAMEVKRSLRYYVKEAGNSDFKKILLMGGSANVQGLAEYFQSQLNIPTEVFNPFTSIEGASGTTDPQYSVAVGLAMRAE